MSEAATFPQPLPTDPEDVAWALSTGQAMWGRGERAEGIRWIKRASDSAADAGDDDRAFALARLAAELKSQVGSIAPPAPAAGPVTTPAPPPVATTPPPAAAVNPPPAEATRQGMGARGTMMMSPAANPAANPGKFPAPGPRTSTFPGPSAGASPVPAAGNPAPTAGAFPAPTAGGFRPRAPGTAGPGGASPAPAAGARPVTAPSPARPQPAVATPSPVRPLAPPTPDLDSSSGPAASPVSTEPLTVPRAAQGVARAFEIPPKLRPAESSSTVVTAFTPPNDEGNDPDDWPTHAASGDEMDGEVPPQLMNEAQETFATSFHPQSPAHLYTPASPTPAAGARPSTQTAAAAPIATPTAVVAPAPSVSSSPNPQLGSFRVWVFPTEQGPRVVLASQPRPEGAIEAVIVAPAGQLDALLVRLKRLWALFERAPRS